MLTALGLDPETEALYRTMLMHSTAYIPLLCEELKRPEETIRQGLDRLSELGLVRPSQEKPGHLRAVSPEVGLELLLTRQQADVAAQQQRIEASRAAAAQLIAEYATSRSTTAYPHFEYLAGIDSIRDRLAELTRNVRHEVMTFAGGEQSVQAIEAAKPLDAQLAERGVTSRTVYLDSARNSPHTTEYLAWLVGQGAQVRMVATLPALMVMFDHARAVIAVSRQDMAAGAVVVSVEGSTLALGALFEMVWDNAQPFADTRQHHTHDLTDSESTVLKFLAAGHTDQAIALRLGISHRTIRRISTSLMNRLGARSRFEAGVQAAKRGWL